MSENPATDPFEDVRAAFKEYADASLEAAYREIQSGLEKFLEAKARETAL